MLNNNLYSDHRIILYSTDQRLLGADAVLAETDYSVAEFSEMVGYFEFKPHFSTACADVPETVRVVSTLGSKRTMANEAKEAFE